MDTRAADEPLGSLVSKAHLSMKNYFNHLIRQARIEITADQWGLLTVVHYAPGISQSDIAQRSRKDKTGVTRMLDLLEKRGYLVREDDETDRRAHRVRVTPEGERVLKQVAPLAAEVNRVSCTGLDAGQVEALKGMLAQIRDNIDSVMKT
jgi:DNA-binding MarR family transcriptional regulator